MSNGPRTLDVSLLLALVTALVYTAGWSYAYQWYDRFELGLIGLGIPSQYFFMYGFWVIGSFWWLMLLIALALAAALLCWDRVAPVLINLAPLWVPPVFFLVYLLGSAAAGWDYEDHRASGFRQYPWVRVWTAPDAGAAPVRLQRVRQDLGDGRYRLLLQTSDSLILLKPKPSGEIATLQVSKSRVTGLRRLATNPGLP